MHAAPREPPPTWLSAVVLQLRGGCWGVLTPPSAPTHPHILLACSQHCSPTYHLGLDSRSHTAQSRTPHPSTMEHPRVTVQGSLGP